MWFLINQGMTHTDHRVVILTLDHGQGDAFAGAVDMTFSNDGTNFSPRETFRPIKNWNIQLHDQDLDLGTKTVYVRFWIDNAPQTILSRSIELTEFIELDEVPYAEITQLIANQLPEWHAGRRLKDSNYQKLLNTIGGRRVERLFDTVNRSINDRYLATASIDEADVLMKVELSREFDLKQTWTSKNLLLNSNFGMQIHPNDPPLSWYSTGTWDIVQDALNGRQSVRVEPTAPGQEFFLAQSIGSLQVTDGNVPSLSLTYKTTGGGILAAPTAGFGARLFLMTSNGELSVSKYVSFQPETNGAWRPAIIPRFSTGLANQVYVAAVLVVAVQTTGSFDFQGTLTVDSIQVEAAGRPTSWEPHHFDTAPWTAGPPQRIPANTSRMGAYYVVTPQDFWEEAIPTRTAFDSSEAGVFEAVPKVGNLKRYDSNKEAWNVQLEILTDKIQRINADVNGEILAEYVLAKRLHPLGFLKHTTPVLEAGTVFHRRLFLVGTEGSDRILYVVDIETPFPEPDYLKIVYAVKLPTQVADTIIKAEFLNDDQQFLHLYSGTTHYVVRLFYDYFTADLESGTLFFRERYADFVVT